MSRQSRRDRQPPERRANFRPSRVRILVLCGGQVAEPEYFEGLKTWAQNAEYAITIRSHRSGPARLVERAIESSDDYDEPWCVTDVDQFLDVEEAAARIATAHAVHLLISNPCFGLWLLLHQADHRAWISCCNGVTRELRRYVPGYDKSVEFMRYQPGLEDAIERAKRLGEIEERFPNPSSGVWELVERILTRNTENQ